MIKPKEKAGSNLQLNLLCISVCYLAIGVVLLCFHSVSLITLCHAVGIAVMIVGIINIAIYFLKKQYLQTNNLGFSFGVAELLIGIFAVINTNDFALIFSQILALCMVFDSIVKLQFSMNLLRIKDKLWWGMLLISLLLIVLSMIILINPFQTDRTRDIYTYSILIADGVINIFTIIYLRRQIKKYDQLAIREL